MRNPIALNMIRRIAPLSIVIVVGSASALPGDPWHRIECCGSGGSNFVHFGTGDCAGATGTAEGFGYEVKGCMDFTENGMAPGGNNYGEILMDPLLPASGPLTALDGVGQGISIGFDWVGGAWAFKGAPGSVERASLRLPRAVSPGAIIGIAVGIAGQPEQPFFGGPLITNIAGDFEIFYYTESAVGPMLNRQSFVIADLQFTSEGLPCSTADLGAPLDELDISDVVTFLQRFGAQDPSADFAAPIGEFDIADVVGFLQAFGAGCP